MPDFTITQARNAKRCQTCGEMKALDDFPRRKGSADGHRGQCRVCIRGRAGAWRASRRDRINAYAREWHQEHSGREAEYRRRYRERHPEVAERYRAANRDRERARASAWVKANPQKHYEHTRARKRRLRPADADTLSFRSILAGDCCSYCGAAVTDIDHLDPVSSGGLNHWSNLTGACVTCNRSKGTGTLLGFLARA